MNGLARSLVQRSTWIALLLGLVSTGWAEGPSEYQVKAVFLFNFTQFVEWPAQAFASANAPFVIGILGKDPFGSQIDNVVRNESVDKHPLVIERYRTLDEMRDCNILFIEEEQTGELQHILAALKGRSVLTVTDSEGGDQQGVMIYLVTQKNRIRLRINVAAAKSSNLIISSKLLRPAEIVGGEG